MAELDRTDASAARPGRGFWRVAIAMVAVLVAGDVVFIVLMSRDPLATHVDRDVAERFFGGLVVGNGSIDPDDPDGESGYSAAWALVSDGFAARTGFDVFVEQQEKLVNEYGFLDSPRKLEREWGDFRKRTLEYRLSFSGTRGRPRSARCRITMVLVGTDYRVDGFEVAPEVEDR